MSVADPTRSDLTTADPLTVVCVEVGASGCESARLDVDGALRHDSGLAAVGAAPLLIAVPGLIGSGRVIAASNLGWYDVDPAQQLGLTGDVLLVRNDAEAAALGEYALRDGSQDLLYLGLGTGVGGAVVRAGEAHGNELGHRGGFGERECRCGLVGCLETVAAGWALPTPLPADRLHDIADALASAVRSAPDADVPLVVVGGGIVAAYPDLVPLVAAALPERTVEASAAPPTVKSAAAWGLLHEFRHVTATSGT